MLSSYFHTYEIFTKGTRLAKLLSLTVAGTVNDNKSVQKHIIKL